MRPSQFRKTNKTLLEEPMLFPNKIDLQIDQHLLGWTSGFESQYFMQIEWLIPMYHHFLVFKKLLITWLCQSYHFLSVIYFMFVSLFIYYRDSSLDNMISVTDMYPSCVLSESAFTPFLSKYSILSYVCHAGSRHKYYQMTDKKRDNTWALFSYPVWDMVSWIARCSHWKYRWQLYSMHTVFIRPIKAGVSKLKL